MSGIRVTAPYVTMKIKQNGGVVITGFYKDAVVQAADVDPEDRERLLAKGMIEEVPEPEVEKKPEKEPDSAKEPAKEHQKAAAKEPEAPSKAAKSSGGGS